LCRAADGAAADRWRFDKPHALTVPGVYGTSEGVRACLKNAPSLRTLGVPARFAPVTRIPGRQDRQGLARAPESQVKNCELPVTGEAWDEAITGVFAALDLPPSSRVQRCT
jgi:hypothetical protein